MYVRVTFWGPLQGFEDEMDGFEKSAKTTRTPPQVPFQTRTRAQSAAEVAAAAAAEVTPIPLLILKLILVDLSSPGNSHSTTGARSITDAHVMLTDDSSAVADVSPTVGVLQHALLRETLLELNEARNQMDI